MFLRHYPLSVISTIAIWGLSLFPVSFPETVTGVPFYDKWGHFLMYGVFTLTVLCETLRERREIWSSGYLWRLLSIVLMSGLLELLQAYATTNRAGEWADLLANSTGVLIGTLIYFAVAKFIPVKS
ncbi:MAG: VanZ family protein [Bacteroidaceae bacterium]|nr:VanZ family protein [Bacteroidaceae bacterium]